MTILIATISYFFGALVVALDKYLLGSKRISSPAVYAFYVGLTGVGVFLFAPLAAFFPALKLSFPEVGQIIISFLSGTFFVAGLLALYVAINKSEASRVTPIVFSVIPLITLIISKLFGSETLSIWQLMGVTTLIFGGLLISFDLPLRYNKKKFFAGFNYSIVSGILQGISLVLLKQVYQTQTFFNGFAWTRLGALIGAILLLLLPAWKKEIFKSIFHAHKEKKKNLQTIGLFMANKILGGTSSFLLNLAILLGSVTLVSSMIALQYVFVLIIAMMAAKKLPHIFEEKLKFWDWFQKIIAIGIIGIGLYFISI